MTPTQVSLPNRGWDPNEDANKRAVSQARAAVGHPDAGEWLQQYYRTNGDYAGATFLELGDNRPNSIGAMDLFAATTLNVSISAAAIRRVEAASSEISKLLEQLPIDARIEDPTTPERGETMAELQDLLKRTLGGKETSNPWVTAAKVTARKRPNLFPVRDRVVIAYLGLGNGYREHWPAFAAIMRDEALVQQLRERVEAARGTEGVHVGDTCHLLRHLDVVLWRAGNAATADG